LAISTPIGRYGAATTAADAETAIRSQFIDHGIAAARVQTDSLIPRPACRHERDWAVGTAGRRDRLPCLQSSAGGVSVAEPRRVVERRGLVGSGTAGRAAAHADAEIQVWSA
jgi:hypothetical protein